MFAFGRFAHSGNSSCGLFLFCSQGVGAFARVTWVGVPGLSGLPGCTDVVTSGVIFVSTFVTGFTTSGCFSGTIGGLLLTVGVAGVQLTDGVVGVLFVDGVGGVLFAGGCTGILVGKTGIATWG